MIRNGLLALIALLTLAFAPAALAQDAPETWSCNYNGKWTTNGSASKGDFKWVVKWERTSTGWHIIGDYKDSYGDSLLDGHCAENKCDLKQSYTNGSLNGKIYNWSGTYTDKAESPTKTINNFQGTWTDASGKGNSGKWTAKATCTKQ
jgi:hypothetical protein